MTSKKNVHQFLHPILPPLPVILSVRMGPNWARPPTPGRPKLGYQPPPPLSTLVFLRKIEMLKRKPKCCLIPCFHYTDQVSRCYEIHVEQASCFHLKRIIRHDFYIGQLSKSNICQICLIGLDLLVCLIQALVLIWLGLHCLCY